MAAGAAQLDKERERKRLTEYRVCLFLSERPHRPYRRRGASRVARRAMIIDYETTRNRKAN